MSEITYYGTATVQLSLPGGTRLITDPAFDDVGIDYGMAGQNVTRTMDASPPPPAADIDAVLLSHPHHPDNFDRSGRTFAAQVGRILGTKAVAALSADAVALGPWEQHTIGTNEHKVVVTAVPAFHGPADLLHAIGETTGFVIETAEMPGAIYISGDTVYSDQLTEIGRRFAIHTAVLHFGAAKLPAFGDSPLTLTADDGARLAHDLGIEQVVPVHYEGWGHFTEGRAEIERAFRAYADAPALVWLEPGVPTELDARARLVEDA